MKRVKITTGDYARAVLDKLPIATDDMVRGWCEEGLLQYWRNPAGGRYIIDPECIYKNLREFMGFSHEEAEQVGSRLGLSFKNGTPQPAS